MKCSLSVGQTRGQKRKVVFDSDDEPAAGPSSKKAQVASPKRGSEGELAWWWERIADALDVTNAEQKGLRAQIEGLRRGVEAANAECWVVRTQLEGICTAFEYVAGLAFKAYIGSGLNAEVE